MPDSFKISVKIVGLLTAMLLLISSTPVLAVTTNDLRAVENKAAESRRKINQAKADKERLNSDIKSADLQLTKTVQDLSKLEEELANKRAERDKITAKLNILREELAKTEEELRQALIELDRLSGILNERAGNVYKNGEMSFLEVLFEARNFTDFIHRAQFLQTIISVDADLVKDIKKTRRKIEQSKTRIEKDKAVVQKEEDELTIQLQNMASIAYAVRSKKDEIQGQIAAKESLIAKITSDQKQWEAEAIESERSANRIRSQLSSSSSSGGGATLVAGTPSASGFIWPANGPLTSSFGPRWGRMHNGIDIGAPMGAPVWASKAGRVVTASWYGGYGNLVVIDHGGGVSTWYGHNSSILVSVGQQVVGGQQIAKCGSTGHSTGPHVHFEIRYNGNPVNPRNYL